MIGGFMGIGIAPSVDRRAGAAEVASTLTVIANDTARPGLRHRHA